MPLNYRQAQHSLLSKGQISALAQSIAEQLDFGPGDDIHQLVKRLGGSVRVEDTLTDDPERSGSLYVDAPGDFKIIVPAHTSLLRDRFTIAHELGHYFVHYLWASKQPGGSTDPMIALRKGSERIEWEANWFAAAFLMPSEKFKAEFEAQNRNVSTVAAYFGVSQPAAEVRVRQLGLD